MCVAVYRVKFCSRGGGRGQSGQQGVGWRLEGKCALKFVDRCVFQEPRSSRTGPHRRFREMFFRCPTGQYSHMHIGVDSALIPTAYRTNTTILPSTLRPVGPRPCPRTPTFPHTVALLSLPSLTTAAGQSQRVTSKKSDRQHTNTTYRYHQACRAAPAARVGNRPTTCRSSRPASRGC